MRKFILIRTYREEDKPVCKELLKSSVMYPLNHTFIGFLLGTNVMRIINVLSIVLMVVLLQTGFYVVYCIMVIFIPGIILYISLLSKFLYEARIVGNEVSEISRIYTSDNSSCFWIAEAYDDYSLNDQDKNQPYIFMTEEELIQCNIDVSEYYIEIVGIMSFCRNNLDTTLGCIKNFYVKKYYRKNGIGSQLMNQTLRFAHEHGIGCVKATVSQFQKHVMNFFNTRNFSIYSRTTSEETILNISDSLP
ncbi:uncharacterized protein LOC118443644 isoform X14 [Vespa mandarinia]|uniref:uncharacterized protein LOC118443644 isoform X14 n=1 Tax=Vespa mandarinia TaxID=7446 RepID=UPI0016150C6B|nr:uncharacterized protein LOC118443644 isoform X14 [Vespa mandarinia]XP_035726824.1 uncharacterized protein LOC118443644 isoform X14 [Vespa mandarinia]